MNIERNKNQQLKEAIVKTIAFFDLFNYPLTAFEVWQFLPVKCGLEEVYKALEITEKLKNRETEKQRNIETEEQLEMKNGFYFLKGREETVDIRMSRYNETDKKFKRAILIAKIYRFLPWIKMIAVGNLIGSDNLKESGDIDLFIITAEKRIWITRFFCVGIAKLLGMRPKKGRLKDKICLSFFIDESRESLEDLMINFENGKDAFPKDIYFVYWLANAFPLFNLRGAYENLISGNKWLRSCLPNWEPLIPSRRRRVEDLNFLFFPQLVDIFFGGLNTDAKKLQLKILPAEIEKEMNQGKKVVIGDNIIKTHTNDRREEVINKYSEKLKELGI